MKRIKDLWEEISGETSGNDGIFLRRYSADIRPDIYVIVQNPENLYGFAISVSKNIRVDVNQYSDLREITLEIIVDKNDTTRTLFVFKLLNRRHIDIFAVLCEDLINSVKNIESEPVLVKVILERFEKWKNLFKKLSTVSLTDEEQRGLYGELFLLRKLLIYEEKRSEILSSWVGMYSEIRDFQRDSWAVEVKTTIGNNHQKLHVSNERQLDNSKLACLYLFHVSLEKRNEGGESLPMIVNSIRDILKAETLLTNRFEAKLIEAGYLEDQEDLYSQTGYIIRQENFFEVKEDFPRIQEGELRSGVGDIKYTILLSNCLPHIITETNVLTEILM